MKPQKAYNFNIVQHSKLNLILFIFLIFQIFIFSISHYRIQIPKSIVNFAIKHDKKSYDLKLSKIEYKFPNSFFLEKCEFFHNKSNYCFENVSFSFDSFFEKIKFNNFSIDRIRIDSDKYNFVLNDITGCKNKENIITRFRFESEFLISNFLGIFNTKELIKLSSKI